MDPVELKKYLDKPRNLERYAEQRAYFEGRHVGILNPAPKSAPDNRKPIPLARRAVRLLKGYMAKPGTITYMTDPAEAFDPIKAVYDENDEQLETADAFEKACVHGTVFELHYTENNVPQFALLPIDQCIPIFSPDLKPKLVGFIWHRKTDDQELANVYTDTDVEFFVKGTEDGAEWQLDPEHPPVKHGYGEVPVNIGRISADGSNLYDHTLPLIDLLDKIMSEDIADELQRFAGAYMLFANELNTTLKDENGLTDADRSKIFKMFDKLGDNVRNQVAFLERNINGAFISESADRVERYIYEMLMLFNPNDKDFAQQSGIAQAYKLLGFEYLAADIESYFTKFLQHRLTLVNAINTKLGKGSVDVDSVQISMKRNLPFDLQNLALVASQLAGTFDLQAILDLFPAQLLSPEAKKRILDAQALVEPLPDPSSGEDPVDGDEDTDPTDDGK